MLSLDQIHTIAQKYQTTELNVRREYFQHLFLAHFYQQPQADTIYFKGGTALRIIYRSPRFSEDLDFSAPLTDTTVIETTLEQTLSSIHTENVPVSLEEAKPTSGGYLAIISFPNLHSITLHLEISKRDSDTTHQVVTIVNDFIPSYTITALSSQQLVAEKIAALMGRNKPRDFYDLYFILRASLLTPEQKNQLPQIRSLLDHTSLNFEAELKLFLPKSHWATIRDFKTTLDSEINRYI